MDNIWLSILLAIITGLVSSSLVVIYFEFRQYRKHKLSRAHILERFSRELFQILTTVRIVSDLKLRDVSSQDRLGAVKELERVLGRNDPGVLMGKILNLTPDQHRYLFDNLTQIYNSLSLLFLHSIAHKTIEDKVSASIAEMQEWIDSVLQYYVMFPEIIEQRDDQTIRTMWMTSIFNLVENSFAILPNVLKSQKVSEGALRWGSRSK